MSTIVPTSRPQQSESDTRALIGAAGVNFQVVLVGVRGYFKKTMGDPNKNDRGIYDDAIFLVSPRLYLAFNANTDPSRYGVNQKIGKGLTVLQAGVWMYKLGLHGITHGHPYEALVQAAPVTVIRDGGVREIDFLALNIHRGSLTSTGSEGCQTTYPTQWEEFIAAVKSELAYYRQEKIPYLLTEA